MNGPRATYYPAGVLFSAPYDAVATPTMVEEFKRAIPAYCRRYLPDTREWFVTTPYAEQALAIFRRGFPAARVVSDRTAPPPPPSAARPMAEEHHYAALHLRASAPREVVDAVYRVLVKVNHPDRLPLPQRDRAHQQMCAINAAYEALHAHTAQAPYDADGAAA